MPVLHWMVPLLVTRRSAPMLSEVWLAAAQQARETEGVEGGPDRANAESVLIRCLETL